MAFCYKEEGVSVPEGDKHKRVRVPVQQCEQANFLLLQIHPKATEDQQRLAQRFQASCLRGNVLTVGEILAIDIQLSP